MKAAMLSCSGSRVCSGFMPINVRLSCKLMIIRAEQFQTLEEAADRDFDRMLAGHLRQFTLGQPGINDDAIMTLVARVRPVAHTYGLTTAGGIRLIAELMCLLGYGFPTDSMIPLAPDLLDETSDDPGDRADILQAAAGEYLDAVAGPGDSNLVRALEMACSSSAVIDAGGTLSREAVAAFLERLFPEKAAHAGESGIQGLLGRVGQISHHNGMTDSARLMRLATISLIFGADAMNDPLHTALAGTVREQNPTEFIHYCRSWVAYLRG